MYMPYNLCQKILSPSLLTVAIYTKLKYICQITLVVSSPNIN